MYVLITIIVLIFISLLTLTEKKYPKKFPYVIIESVLSALSVILMLVTPGIIDRHIESVEDYDTREWMAEGIQLFYDLTVPVMLFFAVLLIISLIVKYTQKKNRPYNTVIRIVSFLLFPTVLMLVGVVYSLLISNDTVNLEAYVYFYSVCEALILRAITAAELILDRHLITRMNK